MIITVEISYYPLTADYSKTVGSFIRKITESGFLVEVSKMSTLITGEYKDVMDHLTKSIGEIMDAHPSVFNLKISNSCPV